MVYVVTVLILSQTRPLFQKCMIISPFYMKWSRANALNYSTVKVSQY